MAKRVIWAPNASRQWMHILNYLLEVEADPKSIERLWHRILSVIQLLKRHPLVGRPTVEKNVRVVLIWPFHLFYEVQSKHLVILMIRDMRRKPL